MLQDRRSDIGVLDRAGLPFRHPHDRTATGSDRRADCRCLLEEIRFAMDSTVEGNGFEPSVPLAKGARQNANSFSQLDKAKTAQNSTAQTAAKCGALRLKPWGAMQRQTPRSPPKALGCSAETDSTLEEDGFELPVRARSVWLSPLLCRGTLGMGRCALSVFG
jgi:hypothetical protein